MPGESDGSIEVGFRASPKWDAVESDSASRRGRAVGNAPRRCVSDRVLSVCLVGRRGRAGWRAGRVHSPRRRGKPRSRREGDRSLAAPARSQREQRGPGRAGPSQSHPRDPDRKPPGQSPQCDRSQVQSDHGQDSISSAACESTASNAARNRSRYFATLLRARGFPSHHSRRPD